MGRELDRVAQKLNLTSILDGAQFFNRASKQYYFNSLAQRFFDGTKLSHGQMIGLDRYALVSRFRAGFGCSGQRTGLHYGDADAIHLGCGLLGISSIGKEDELSGS